MKRIVLKIGDMYLTADGDLSMSPHDAMIVTLHDGQTIRQVTRVPAGTFARRRRMAADMPDDGDRRLGGVDRS